MQVNDNGSAPFNVRRQAHVNLYVDDVDRSMGFYRDVMGIEQVYWKAKSPEPDSAVIGGFLSNGNSYHDLAVFSVGRPAGLNHMAFDVTTERALVDGYQAASDRGFSFERCADHVVARSLYTTDVDGHGVEVYCDTTPDWRELRGDGRVVRDLDDAWTPGDPARFGSLDDEYFDDPPVLRVVEDALFRTRRSLYSALMTPRIDEMKTYYTDLLGLEVVVDEAGLVGLVGSTGDLAVTLHAVSDEGSAGFHHFGLPQWDQQDVERGLSQVDSGLVDYVTDDQDFVLMSDPDGVRFGVFADQVWSAGELCRRIHAVVQTTS